MDGTTAQWADHFTAEQDEAARAKSQILQAVQTNTVVDAYVTVHEGDVDALKRTLEHQITISGGHVAPTRYSEVSATIPASYLPCLEKIAALHPSKETTVGYQRFVLSAVSDRTPCPYRNGDAVNRTVRIEIDQKPVGLMLDEDAAAISVLLFFFIIPLHFFLLVMVEMYSEPVYDLFRISTVKASTTICRLVLSFLSQFFQSRRHFSSQAKDRSTTHRFGSTTKVCSSLRFTTSTEAPNRLCTAVAKGFPV